MIAQRDAVARLLSDGDADTVRLVKEQLLLGGEDYLRDLEALAAQPDIEVSRHARDVLDAIRRTEAEEDFDLTCRLFCDCCDVEAALWQLGPALDPTLEVAQHRQRIEQWGRQFAVRISDAVSSRERVLALSNFMAGELCFRGNAVDYHNPRNSLFPSVIESRMGLPIVLTLVYRMVALRAGMIVDGLNLPGHFIARHEDVYFDPFYKGRILTRADIGRLVERQGRTLTACHLLPAPPRIILLRVLSNLLFAYTQGGDTAHQAKVQHWFRLVAEPA